MRDLPYEGVRRSSAATPEGFRSGERHLGDQMCARPPPKPSARQSGDGETLKSAVSNGRFLLDALEDEGSETADEREESEDAARKQWRRVVRLEIDF